MDFTLHYSNCERSELTCLSVRRVGLSVAKQIYVLQKNGAYRWRHRFDSRQHNCPLS